MKNVHESQKGNSKVWPLKQGHSPSQSLRERASVKPAGEAAQDRQSDLSQKASRVFNELDDLHSAVVRARGLLNLLSERYASLIIETKAPTIPRLEAEALNLLAWDVAELLEAKLDQTTESFIRLKIDLESATGEVFGRARIVGTAR